MKDKILQNLEDAKFLESLYRKDKPGFRKAFLEVSVEMPAGTAREFWIARLEGGQENINWGRQPDWLLVVASGLSGGLILKIPEWFVLSGDNYFPRNIAFVFLPSLLLFLGFRSRITLPKIGMTMGCLLLSAFYINIIPGSVGASDSLFLACLHLPVFYWLILAYADGAGEINGLQPRLDFIRFSAELLVMSGLVLGAAGLFTAIILGLFQTIGIPLEKIYFNYFGVFGLGAIPVTAALLLKENPLLLKQVAPVVAGIFSPLALIALIIFLPALLMSGKNLFQDRDFLLIFNLLLLGVLALIFFALPELTKNPHKKSGLLVLSGLAIITLLINGIAVSAILYRILSFGITINRAAVLGSNILILTNLLLMSRSLIQSKNKSHHLEDAGKSIALFLPLYGIWALIVAVLFPLLAGFR